MIISSFFIPMLGKSHYTVKHTIYFINIATHKSENTKFLCFESLRATHRLHLNQRYLRVEWESGCCVRRSDGTHSFLCFQRHSTLVRLVGNCEEIWLDRKDVRSHRVVSHQFKWNLFVCLLEYINILKSKF